MVVISLPSACTASTVQDFTTQMQKAQAEYQWMQAQLQYCMAEYEKAFASYQPQQQGE